MKKWLLVLLVSVSTLPFWGCSTTGDPQIPLTDAAQLYELFDSALARSGSRVSQSFTISTRRTDPFSDETTWETEIYSVFLSGSTRRISYFQDIREGDDERVFRKVVDEAPLGTFTEYATTDAAGTIFETGPYAYELDLNTYFTDFYDRLPALIAQYGIHLSDLLDEVKISRNDSYRQGDSVHLDLGFSTGGEEATFRAAIENGYLVYAWFSDPEGHHLTAEFWVGECVGIELPAADD